MAKTKVLVVEDEVNVASGIAMVLDKLGYDVSAIVKTGEEAIKQAREESPDAVLMDIMLSGQMDGIEAASIIKEELDIPVIFLTAHSEDQIIEMAKGVEPFGYIMKPFHEREIKASIEIGLYKKKMERRLQQSETKYRTIFESMEDGYYEVDLAGNLTFVNEPLCRLRGSSKEELLGMNSREYMDLETAKRIYKIFNGIYRTGNPAKIMDYTIIRKDGSRQHCESSVSMIKDSEGRPIGFRGIVRDVTERRRIEEELRKSEERYRTIHESIEDGYYEVDLAGNFIFFNDSFLKIVGYTRDELLGANFRAFTDQEKANDVFKAYNKVYTTGVPLKGYDWEFSKKNVFCEQWC